MKIARILVLAVASMAALASCKKDAPGGETATKYDVKCAEVKNGKISASAAQAEAGTSITLTATADQGYEFGAWSVVNASTGDAVAVTDNKFTMPAANVNVSATFFKEGMLKTIDEIFAAAEKAGSTETEVTVGFNNYVVTGIATNKKNAYVTDGTKGFIVFADNHGFEAGDVISGVADCKVQLYKGAAELTALTSATEGVTVTKGGQVAPAKIAIADLSGVNTGALVAFESLSYNGAVFTDGTNTITPYVTFITLPALLKGKKYEVTGVYIQYGDTKEIAPRTENDIKPVAMPEYAVNIAKDIANGKVEVNFSKATEGQEVQITATPDEGYKLKAVSVVTDGTKKDVPVEAGNVFNMPGETVTVSAEFEKKGGGTEQVYKTALFGKEYNSKAVSSYTDTFSATNNGFTVDLANFNNNNNGWNYVKAGSKNNASVGTITTRTAVDDAVTKVVVTIDVVTAANVNSITLYSGTSIDSCSTNEGEFVIAKGTQTVTISSPSAGKFYKISFDCKKSSNNGVVQVSKVEYYAVF